MLTTEATCADRAIAVPSHLPREVSPAADERQPWRWPYAVAGVLWVLYSIAAVQLTEVMHYQIGDSMARIADARYMLFSRDPHLAAVGMYWMPLPVVGQLPFMLVLSPLHHAEMAGPLATAFVGALTVLVLTRICRFLRLPTATAVGLTLVYALNPVIIFNAANGMSEQWTFLGCALLLLGFLRWSKDHRTMDLAMIACGMAVVMLVRYEAVLLAPFMAVAATLNDPKGMPSGRTLRQLATAVRSRLRRWITVVAVIVLPTFYLLGLWFLLQYVIMRDPLYFYKTTKAIGKASATGPWLPAHLTLTSTLTFVTGMTFAVVPMLFAVLPIVVWQFRRRPSPTGLGLVAGALFWPGLVIAGLAVHASSGAPRYFEPAIIFLVVTAMWLASEVRLTRVLGSRLIALGLILAFAVGGVATAASLDNPTRTGAESEHYFFGQFFGHDKPVSPVIEGLEHVDYWKKMAADLDPELAQGKRVIIDAAIDYSAFVFTKLPSQYIVDSDRDYLRVLADPVGHFDFVVQAIGHRNDGTDRGPHANAISIILANTGGGHWEPWKSYYMAVVYRWVSNGPQSGPS